MFPDIPPDRINSAVEQIEPAMDVANGIDPGIPVWNLHVMHL
ncbi:MAG: hypothetical protein WDN48_15415 [Pseudolabrys sp.]